MTKLIILILSIALFSCSTTDGKKAEEKGASSSSNTETSDKEKQQNLAESLSLLLGEPAKVDSAEIGKHPLGSAENPIRVAGPAGERKYLARLICDNGEKVSAFSRVGSTGIGPYGSMLDVYTVICDTEQGAVNHTVFMDMYHGNYVETRPAHGFKALDK